MKNPVILTMVTASVGVALILTVIMSDTVGWRMHLSSAPNKLVCPRLENTYECARAFERRVLKRYANIVSRNGEGLTIRLINNAELRIDDNDQLIQPVELEARGRFVIMRQQLFESDGWVLVDRLNGQVTKTSAHPIFSPDFTRFVCAAGAGFDPAVLDVYVVNAAGASLEFEGGQSASFVDIYNLTWINNTTISFESLLGDQASETGKMTARRMLLEMREGRWELHAAAN